MFRLLVLFVVLILHIEAKCPANFEEFNFACYFFSQSAVQSYNQAFNDCFNRGGYLVNINAEPEQDYIVKKLKEQNNLISGFWTGGVYNGQYWVWQKTSDWHGTVVQTYMDPNGYNNWGPMANQAVIVGQQAKMAILRTSVTVPYKWYALYTNPFLGRMSYICEADDK